MFIFLTLKNLKRKIYVFAERKDKMSERKPIVVLILGGIGVGKSSLMEILKEHIQFDDDSYLYGWCPEPIDVWTNFGAQEENMLLEMYKRPEIHGFEFQLIAAGTKNEQLKDLKPVSIIERSFCCQQSVFVPLLYETGCLTARQKTILDMILDRKGG